MLRNWTYFSPQEGSFFLQNRNVFFCSAALSMSNKQGSEKEGGGRKAGSVFGWRPVLERLRLGKRPVAGRLNPVLSWIHVYIVGLYLVDYGETMIGTGIGIPELNPLVATLMNVVGNLAFPIVFLMVLVGIYFIVGRYEGSPRLVTAVLLVVGGNETVNVMLNLLSILHKTAVLR
jgi:hypothetical protein